MLTDRDPQQIVDVAGHPVDLHHLGHRRHRLGERVEPFGRMVGRLDLDEDRKAEPDRCRD